MQRIFTIVAIALFSLSTASGAFAKDKKSTAMSSMAPMPMTTTCPTGQTAVKGYMRKDGKMVKPYCRKGASSSMKSSSMKTKSPKPKAT